MERTDTHQRRNGLYGAFAYASVIITGFASFLPDQVYFHGPLWVVVVFALGALHAALGVLSGSYRHAPGTQRGAGYYSLQLAILTAILILSPSRGFLTIIVLPLLSQAIFDLGPRVALGIGAYLFALSCGIWVGVGGWGLVAQMAMNYSTAFIFTIAFTLLTRQALRARTREETLRRTVEAANEQLRAQAAQAEELATMRERNRLAREIHDGVGHYLTVVKTQLDAATALLPADPERARTTVLKASHLAAEALDDVRRSVGALRTDTARPPLPDALRGLSAEVGLPVAVSVAGDIRPLSPAVEHALFRAAQEGLTNVRKHAQASQAELSLHFGADQVHLRVLDDGRAAAVAPRDGGFGLRGMRERIELLGGRVECGPRPEGGFALQVEVPA